MIELQICQNLYQLPPDFEHPICEVLEYADSSLPEDGLEPSFQKRGGGSWIWDSISSDLKVPVLEI